MEDNIQNLIKTRETLKPFRKLCDIEKRHLEADIDILEKMNEILTMRINREVVDRSKYNELKAIGCPPWEMLATIAESVHIAEEYPEETEKSIEFLPAQYINNYREDFFYDCCLKNCEDCWMNFINDLIAITNDTDLSVKEI